MSSPFPVSKISGLRSEDPNHFVAKDELGSLCFSLLIHELHGFFLSVVSRSNSQVVQLLLLLSLL